MIYSVADDFIKISAERGTVQNSSNIYTLELSDTNVKNSGVLIYPLNKISFSGEKYLRCVDGGSVAARVVTFADISGGTSSDGTSADNADDFINDIWNNSDDIINDIWNNAGTSSATDTDNFIDDLNDLFNP